MNFIFKKKIIPKTLKANKLHLKNYISTTNKHFFKITSKFDVNYPTKNTSMEWPSCIVLSRTGKKEIFSDYKILIFVGYLS